MSSAPLPSVLSASTSSGPSIIAPAAANAVESHLGGTPRTPTSSNNGELPRLITHSLASLLHALEDLSSLTEPILHELLTEFIAELSETEGTPTQQAPDLQPRKPLHANSENGHNETNVVGTNTKNNEAHTKRGQSIPTGSSPHRSDGASPATGSVTADSAAHTQGPGDSSNPHEAVTSQGLTSLHRATRSGSDVVSSVRNQAQVASPPDKSSPTATASAAVHSDPRAVEVREMAAKALNTRDLPPHTARSTQAAPFLLPEDPTKLHKSQLALDPKLVAAYKELIISLLSQPGALQNELEEGLFNSLVRALPLRMPASNGATREATAEGRFSFSLSDHPLSDSPSGFSLSRLVPNGNGSAPLPETSEGNPRRDFQLRSQGSASLPETLTKVIDRSFSRASDLAQPQGGSPREQELLSPQVYHNATKLSAANRYALGIISDPSILAALQGAAVKRSYDAFARRKKSIHARRRSERHEGHDEGKQGAALGLRSEVDQEFNPTDRESAGLSLLRAMMGLR